MEAIDELSPMFQEVVRLRDIEDRPNAEVAPRLHRSKRNVTTRPDRPHRLLRCWLQAQRGGAQRPAQTPTKPGRHA